MSWDISIEILGINGEYYEVEEVGNYTYNVNSMYHKAIGWEGLNQNLNNRQCADVINDLQKGIKNMENYPGEYIKLNPENNWGNYEGALEYLKKILAACKKTPEGIVRVN